MSTEKTEKLALHRWVAEDLFLRTEFNENFTAIDQQFASVDDRLATHAAQHGTGGTDPITPDMIGAASRPNLLDNWYFADPVNQRGQAEYTLAGQYGIDRWVVGNAVLTLNDGYITLEQNSADFWLIFYQLREDPSEFADRTVTFSVLYRTADSLRLRLNIAGKHVSLPASPDKWAIGVVTVENPTLSGHMIEIASPTGSVASVDLLAAKLELGPTQTLAHKDADGNWVLNDPPPDKGLELLKCITSTADANDAYANKTVAAADETVPVSGTYTGTGAARSVAVGGNGKVCLVWSGTHYAFVNESGFVYIWSSEGLSSGSGGVTDAAKPVTFADGVLSFAASTVYPTGYTIMNREGTTYNYQVL